MLTSENHFTSRPKAKLFSYKASKFKREKQLAANYLIYLCDILPRHQRRETANKSDRFRQHIAQYPKLKSCLLVQKAFQNIAHASFSIFVHFLLCSPFLTNKWSQSVCIFIVSLYYYSTCTMQCSFTDVIIKNLYRRQQDSYAKHEHKVSTSKSNFTYINQIKNNSLSLSYQLSQSTV